jgi:hypothetical protein
VATVALANKNARIIWALLTHDDQYRPSILDQSGMARLAALRSSPPASVRSAGAERRLGAAARVKASDTAFAHRQYPYNFSIFSSWVNPAEAERNLNWTRECWDAMRPFMAEGSYVNYLEDDEADPLARAAYGRNHGRLATLKNKYDSTNFFRMNHNIKPSRAA